MNEEEQSRQILDAVSGQQTPGTKTASSQPLNAQDFRIFPYSISRRLIERIIDRLNLHHVSLTNHIHDASAVIALRGSARPGSKLSRLAEDYEVPVYAARANTMPQIQRAMREALHLDVGALSESLESAEAETDAHSVLQAVRDAVQQVLTDNLAVEAVATALLYSPFAARSRRAGGPQ